MKLWNFVRQSGAVRRVVSIEAAWLVALAAVVVAVGGHAWYRHQIAAKNEALVRVLRDTEASIARHEAARNLMGRRYLASEARAAGMWDYCRELSQDYRRNLDRIMAERNE